MGASVGVPVRSRPKVTDDDQGAASMKHRNGDTPTCCPVIVTAPAWDLCGINTVAANLIQGLDRQGVAAHVLLTHSWRESDDPMPPVPGIRMETLPGARQYDLRHNWRCLARYLEAHAPCVYIPNYDFDNSCICPRLPKEVMAVGVVHSDDPMHYDHVARVGRYWNATVAVSDMTAAKVKQMNPELASRVFTIRNGVSVVPVVDKTTRHDGARLRIVYAGRIIQHQKRVFDLPHIARALVAAGVGVEMTILGNGPDSAGLRDAARDLTQRDVIRFPGPRSHADTQAVFAESDVVILTSDFEGMPMTLLEAMAQGCIPVVTDIASGIPELVQDDVTGYRVPVGDIAGFVARLATLATDRPLRARLSAAAHSAIVENGYTTERMASQYMELFRRIWQETQTGTWRRPPGAARLPSWLESPYRQQRLANRIRVKMANVLSQLNAHRQGE